MNNTLTALKGVKVGYSTHHDKLTGCTYISFDKDYPVAYKSYGGAPGTNHQTQLSLLLVRMLSSHTDYERLAHIASHGQVRAIYPVHSSVDGDTVIESN